MIQVIQISTGHVCFEFATVAEFNEAFPNGVTEPGFRAVDSWGFPLGHDDKDHDMKKDFSQFSL